VILIDTNVFMYAAGSAHRFRKPSVSFLEGVTAGEVDAAIDAEVLQEILHRYRALRRWDQGRQVYDLTRRIVPHVVPVTAEVVDRARGLLDGHAGLMARDALHAAACLHYGAEALCSFDADFDAVPGLRRIEPGRHA